MLVKRDQEAERAWIEFAEKDRVGRPVSLEHLVRNQGFQGSPMTPAPWFRPDLFRGLAAHQRFGLSQEVGEQDGMMFANRVLGLDRCQEIGQDDPRPWWINW